MRIACVVVLAVLPWHCSSQITRGQCLDQGGIVVGDIGNGQVFLPGYVCEINDLPPIAFVQAGPGEAIASEGEVCCGGSSSGPAPPPLDSSPPILDSPEELTRQECEDAEGVIVGDIGNGAIFRLGYLCESNGLPPIARIVQGGTQIAREGEVCCGTAIISSRETLTRQQCLDQGGEIVGDIGNGAIRDRDFVCPSTGNPPIADVIAGAEEPIAIEGEVCCGTNDIGDSGGEEESSSFSRAWSLFIVVLRVIASLLL